MRTRPTDAKLTVPLVSDAQPRHFPPHPLAPLVALDDEKHNRHGLGPHEATARGGRPALIKPRQTQMFISMFAKDAV